VAGGVALGEARPCQNQAQPELHATVNSQYNAKFRNMQRFESRRPSLAVRSPSAKLLAGEAVNRWFADLGGTVLPGSATDFSKLIADDTEKWGKVIKFAGIKPG
jgi:hypothetical protein